MAGTRKSTVAISVASKLRQTPKCLASFFFRHRFGDLTYARKLVPAIARQFARSSPTYQRLVLKVIETDPDLGQSVNLRDQYERLILEPLRILQSSVPAPDPFFAVIDAVDECDQEKDLQLLLRLFATTKDLSALHLRSIVTSRPEWVIQQGFQNMPSIFHQNLVLHDLPRKAVDRDIEAVLRHEPRLVQQDRNLSFE